jgi:tRNA-specific adenosine deaminase 1
MELIMAAQDDASPWDVPTSLAETDCEVQAAQRSLPGRAYFSQLGVVRRKPARGDAPPSMSKSCSDKIALKQCTSLLSSLTALLVSPEGVYLESLILPASQFSAVACCRSFSTEGRMSSMTRRHWAGGYSFVPFRVETTTEEFHSSKRAVAARSDKTSASNLAVAWSSHGLEEGLVGGVLQGRKQFDLKGASRLSRRRTWSLAVEISRLCSDHSHEDAMIHGPLAAQTYKKVKESELLRDRCRVKRDVREHALTGWLRNTGDEDFGL